MLVLVATAARSRRRITSRISRVRNVIDAHRSRGADLVRRAAGNTAARYVGVHRCDYDLELVGPAPQPPHERAWRHPSELVESTTVVESAGRWPCARAGDRRRRRDAHRRDGRGTDAPEIECTHGGERDDVAGVHVPAAQLGGAAHRAGCDHPGGPVGPDRAEHDVARQRAGAGRLTERGVGGSSGRRPTRRRLACARRRANASTC